MECTGTAENPIDVYDSLIQIPFTVNRMICKNIHYFDDFIN